MADDRGQMSDDREQTTEDRSRCQRTEGREHGEWGYGLWQVVDTLYIGLRILEFGFSIDDKINY
jgi:hypothetical protein